MRKWAELSVFFAVLAFAGRAVGGDKQADPSNYKDIVPTLAPGDTLHLAGGDYAILSISGLNGSAAQWITISGPETGTAAVFHADPGPCCNTVEIADSSYFALEHVTIDGGHVDGAFGISAKDGIVHDIRIEGCTLVNHDGGQQHDGISTKVPTWGWIIRGNRITGVGTGMYLGNSDGTDPFVGGIIENNLIEDPIGYCMEIKWQQPRPVVQGMPQTPTTTIVRNNVFIKNDGPSPDGDRPNVLVGGFPDSGPGSEDRYEIYGNFFFHNPRESLLQASGRVSIHDNVFVDAAFDAVTLADHDLPLKLAYAYNNTIYTSTTGIRVANTASQGDAIAGNLVFAATPTAGSIGDLRDNLTGMLTDAPQLVAKPSLTLGEMDFYPLPGKCQGTPLDMTKFAGDTDYARDFNGTDKDKFVFRGAYAGEGTNPGWGLSAGIKDGGASGTAGGASSSGPSGGTGGGAATGSVGSAGNATPPSDDAGSGCGCAVPGRSSGAPGILLAAAGAASLLVRRRRQGGELGHAARSAARVARASAASS